MKLLEERRTDAWYKLREFVAAILTDNGTMKTDNDEFYNEYIDAATECAYFILVQKLAFRSGPALVDKSSWDLFEFNTCAEAIAKPMIASFHEFVKGSQR